MRTLNKQCLQKPKGQTMCTAMAKARPHPHVRCREEMQEWLTQQEAKTNRRFIPWV